LQPSNVSASRSEELTVAVGFQPTVAKAKSLRRGATLEPCDGLIQASLRDARPMGPFSVG
jgi:hypothetical protein